MNSPTCLRFLFALSLLGVFGIVRASGQTWSERIALRDALNTAKGLIDDMHSETIDLTDPAYGLDSLNDALTGCRAIRVGEELTLIYVEDNNQILLVHKTKEETNIQVPVESHLLVCRMNDWLNHTWVGVETNDTAVDAYGLAGVCTDHLSCPSCQQYFMGTTLVPFVPWIWFPAGTYTIRMGSGPLPHTTTTAKVMVTDPVASASDLISEYHKDVLMVYRKQPTNPAHPDTVFQKRAHFRMDFDYTNVPEPFWDYDLPTGTYPEAGWTKDRLKSIEVIYRFREYSTNNCPPGITLDPDYDPSVAGVTVNVEYNAGGPGNTWTCTWTSADAGQNATVEQANQWLWNARGWNGDILPNWMEFDMDDGGYLFLKTKSRCGPEKTFWSIRLATKVSPAESCYSVFPEDGMFCIDNMTGELVFNIDPPGGPATCPCDTCATIPVTCLAFCEKLSGYRTIENVIAASARTFAGEWEYDPQTVGAWVTADNPNTFFGAKDNRYQRGEGGKWRPKREFGYRSDIKPGTVGNMVYDDAGVFIDDAGNTPDAFHLFNWAREEANDQSKWLNGTTITQYSPSGESVEEYNILNIYSSAKLAHEDIVADIVAANAEYASVAFESFEERENATGDFQTELTSAYAHSGKKSYLLNNGGTPSDALLRFTVTDQIINQGMLLKLWVKNTYGASPPVGESPVKLKVGAAVPYKNLAAAGMGTLQSGLIHKVAQTGEWTLYQLIKDDFTSGDEGIVFEIRCLQNLSSGESLWVDDLRVQPLDAQATCYVYDPNTLRLLAQFDDQHFGSYYQYNGEGKLVRTLRETERGVVTVAETQYHSIEDERFPFGTSPSPVFDGSPQSIGSLPSSDMAASAPSGTGLDRDLLNIDIGMEGASYKIFGSDKLPSLKDLNNLQAPAINSKLLKGIAPDVPELEKVQLLQELIEIDKARAELAEEAVEAGSEEARAELAGRARELDERRRHILREKLGMTEDDVRALYRQLKEEGKAEETNGEESPE